ncbi:hypothetical protein [Teichococcus aestuarii]|uniref:hypothetical protein n=1 Tax=Teichococcus aestuarii TaxID=568898 RepID=UPI00361C14CA
MASGAGCVTTCPDMTPVDSFLAAQGYAQAERRRCRRMPATAATPACAAGRAPPC